MWEPTPYAEAVINDVEYKVNSKGYRDYEYTMEKSDNVFRTAVIGDSVTWGYTELTATYPKVLEEKLKRNIKGVKVEVLNFGIQGAGLKNHLAMLNERVLQCAPDLVILGFCLNDLLDNRRQTQINAMFLWSLQHSHFLNFITSRAITVLRNIRAKTGIMTPERYYLESAKLYDDADMREELEATLQKMALISKNSGAGFVIVLFPFSQQLDKGANNGPQKVLAEVCKRNGIALLDPLEELRTYDLNSLYLKDDPLHFSAYGNRVLATSIANFLTLGNII